MTPTPEQIAQWAYRAGAYPHNFGKNWSASADELQRLVAFACAWQAEQDAKLCEAEDVASTDCPLGAQSCIADAIRASVKGGAA